MNWAACSCWIGLGDCEGPLSTLAKQLPTQLRSLNGEYMPFRLELPEDPLCVTTQILEFEDGRQVPLVSN